MEAQLHRPTHEDPQPVIEGEGVGENDQHGEKKSVLQKVKDKAKKIKDTIKNHGHAHDHEPEHGSDEDEDEDEDAEMVDHPEVHDAPMYDSTVIRSTNLPRQIDANLEKPTDPREDRYNPNVRDEGTPEPAGSGKMVPTQVGKPHVEQPHVPETKDTRDVEASRVQIGGLSDLERDPQAPKTRPGEQVPISNYQSKVNDPTGHGGREANVDPLIRQLESLDVSNEADPNPKLDHKSHTGTHDQFAPQPTPTKDQFTPESDTCDNPKSVPDPANPDLSIPRDTVTGKISSATSAITEKAVLPKNVVAEKLAPVSKVQGSVGAENQVGDKGVSVKEYWAEKFRPGEEDKALCEVISEALNKRKEGKGEGHHPVMGNVTESDEVRAHLGSGKENTREGEDAFAAGSEAAGTGQGVVDKLKGAVSSWLGKSSGIQTAQESVGQSYLSGTGSEPARGVGGGGEEAAQH